jgi:hypothetical protein
MLGKAHPEVFIEFMKLKLNIGTLIENFLDVENIKV